MYTCNSTRKLSAGYGYIRRCNMETLDTLSAHGQRVNRFDPLRPRTQESGRIHKARPNNSSTARVSHQPNRDYHKRRHILYMRRRSGIGEYAEITPDRAATPWPQFLGRDRVSRSSPLHNDTTVDPTAGKEKRQPQSSDVHEIRLETAGRPRWTPRDTSKVICRRFATGKLCPYQERCRYAHEDNLAFPIQPSTRQWYADGKKAPCLRWLNYSCSRSAEECRYHHGKRPRVFRGRERVDVMKVEVFGEFTSISSQLPNKATSQPVLSAVRSLKDSVVADSADSTLHHVDPQASVDVQLPTSEEPQNQPVHDPSDDESNDPRRSSLSNNSTCSDVSKKITLASPCKIQETLLENINSLMFEMQLN